MYLVCKIVLGKCRQRAVDSTAVQISSLIGRVISGASKGHPEVLFTNNPLLPRLRIAPSSFMVD